MRRMIPDPGKIIKCSFENVGRQTKIYIPVKSIDDLPIIFNLMIPNANGIATFFAYYSDINGEVYGGGSFVIPGDNKGNIKAFIQPDSIVYPETTMPYLILSMEYERGDVQTAPIPSEEVVFVSNVIHLEKSVIDIA